jgi:hypothetical protein
LLPPAQTPVGNVGNAPGIPRGFDRPLLPKAGDRVAKTVVAKSPDGTFTAVTGGTPKAVDLEHDKPLFYPVLRHLDGFTELMAYVPVAKDLGIFACRKLKLPNGGVRLDYVMKRQLAEYHLDEPKLIDLCYENFFKEKIQVEGRKQGDDLMVSLTSTGGLVTALLGHPTTRANFTKMLHTEDLAILVDGTDHLLATKIGSSLEPSFSKIVDKSPHWSSTVNLDPAVYHWTKKDGLTRVSPRRKGPSPKTESGAPKKT